MYLAQPLSSRTGPNLLAKQRRQALCGARALTASWVVCSLVSTGSLACKSERASKNEAASEASQAATGEAKVAKRGPAVAPTQPRHGANEALPSAPSPSDSSAPLGYVIIGGGPVPESNEVSVEQDVELVRRALPGPGVVLFAGGGESKTVRELDPDAKLDSVRVALGGLFAPRAGRGSRYRRASFEAEPATRENVETSLSNALSEGTTPLLVYVAGHGDKGEHPEDNFVALWGGGALTVSDLATLHERSTRPMRLVATTCYSGGFAELAFAGANSGAMKPSAVPRCGVFAGTADRETSGCDPNPNRRAQESYGLHLTHALLGMSKDGSPLAAASLDFNNDGVVGLLDAHTWARIEAVSFDLPTTTSERWLRAVESEAAPIVAELVPEDAAVTERLGAVLGVPTEANAESRAVELDHELAALDGKLRDMEQALGEIEDELATALLDRWPYIDDPFHPEFDATFQRDEQAIGELLLRSRTARERQALRQTLEHAYDVFDRLVVQEARILRVLRAYETLHKAAALHRRGGPAARTYEQLLQCERAAVGVATSSK